MVANEFQLKELKEECVRFIQANTAEVKKTDGWKVLTTKTGLMRHMAGMMRKLARNAREYEEYVCIYVIYWVESF